MKAPSRLMPGDKANFETLQRAAANGDLALLSSRDAITGEHRALVCAMQIEGDSYQVVPLAVMPWGNPYELFLDPTIEEDSF